MQGILQILSKTAQIILAIAVALLKVFFRIFKNIYIIITTEEDKRDEALQASYEKDRLKNKK